MKIYFKFNVLIKKKTLRKCKYSTFGFLSYQFIQESPEKNLILDSKNIHDFGMM